MKHLVRAGGLLVGILVLVFVVPRVAPRPVELQSFGFYPKSSEANAVEWANQPLSYADPATCAECHGQNSASLGASEHRTVSCENCHGPGEKHLQSGEALKVDKSRDLCLLCHSRVAGRRATFPQVEVSQHGQGAGCITCHSPHSPKVSAPVAIPHSLQGREQCLLCHASGGMKPVPAGHAGRGQDACQSCHKAK